MITYLDASSLVKYFIEEESSSEVRALVEATLPTTSRLSAVEITSAICRRCREGQISEDARDQVLARLDEVLAELYIIELTPEISASAQQLLRRFPLRAGDSVQLASYLAVRNRTGKSVQFSAFDHRLIEVADRATALAEEP